MNGGEAVQLNLFDAFPPPAAPAAVPAPAVDLPSFEEQTGWRRIHPMQICQDVEALQRVKVFFFDLGNGVFLDYYRRRWGSHPLECELPDLARENIRWSTELRWSLGRGALQDIWELFVTHIEPGAAPSEPWTMEEWK